MLATLQDRMFFSLRSFLTSSLRTLMSSRRDMYWLSPAVIAVGLTMEVALT